MSVTTTINYDNAANFTFDANKVEIVSNKAQLKPQEGAIVKTQTFDSSTGFSFDVARAEFVNGQVRHLEQLATAIYAADFSTDANINWGPGTSTGTLANGAAISGGKLDLSDSGAPVAERKRLDFDGDNLTDYNGFNAMRGSVRFRYTPTYMGQPPQIIHIYNECKAIGDVANQVFLRHTNQRRLQFRMYAADGLTQIFNDDSYQWIQTLDQEYEFLIVWDLTDADINNWYASIYVDGTRVTHLNSGATDFDNTDARGTDIAAIRIGVDYFNPPSQSSLDRSDFELRGLVRYNTAIETGASYVTGYTIPSAQYLETAVQLPAFTQTNPGTFTTLDDFTTTEVGTPRYTVKVDSGNFQYWNGSAWVDSDSTYAQASTASDVDTNIPTLTASGSSSITVQIHFSGGNSGSNVSNLQLDITGGIAYPTDDPAITVASATSVDAISAFSSAETAAGSDSITWILTANGTDRYWDGAAWSTSNGTVAQSNTATVVNANIASFDASAGIDVKWKALLSSDDGTTTPDITSLTFTYDFFVQEPDAISECIVYGWEDDVTGEAIEGATVKATVTTPFFHGNRRIVAFRKETTTNSTGYWELSLIETASVSQDIQITIETPNGSSGIIRKVYSIEVPNQTSAAFSTIASTQ